MFKSDPKLGPGFTLVHFQIPWSKTEKAKGTSILASRWDDWLFPAMALCIHLSFDTSIPGTAELFAYRDANGIVIPLYKSEWMRRCHEIFRSAGLEELLGHCWRIGGTTELPLQGVSVTAIKLLAHWSTDAWKLYVRNTADIIDTKVVRVKARTKAGAPPDDDEIYETDITGNDKVFALLVCRSEKGSLRGGAKVSQTREEKNAIAAELLFG